MKEDNSIKTSKKVTQYYITYNKQRLSDILFDNIHSAIDICTELRKTAKSVEISDAFDVAEITL